MAWTLQLLNDDTTLDLNDGAAYSARPGFLVMSVLLCASTAQARTI
jgi:hypothetical protein